MDFLLIGSLGLLFCLAIGFPLLSLAVSIGELTVWLLKKHPKVAMMLLCFAIFSPILAEPVEAQFAFNTAVTTTHTNIDIEGRSKATIWQT